MTLEEVIAKIDLITDDMTSVVHHLTESDLEALRNLGVVISGWKKILEEVISDSIQKPVVINTSVEQTIEKILKEIQARTDKTDGPA